MIETTLTVESDIKEKIIPPLLVIDNFNWNGGIGVFDPRFVTKEIYWSPQRGSENTTIMSKTEPMFSYAFRECLGALARNRRTGLNTLVHQSRWSTSAEVSLAAQKKDDLDLIILNPRNNYPGHFKKNLIEAHSRGFDEISPGSAANFFTKGGTIQTTKKVLINHLINPGNNLIHHSLIAGISKQDIEAMILEAQSSQSPPGRINYIGTITLPLTTEEMGRVHVLFKPVENLVYVFSQQAEKLFIFPGFPEI